MFEIWRHRGSYNVRLEKSPIFESIAHAEVWISLFLKDDPKFLELDTLSIKPWVKGPRSSQIPELWRP
jgi:hypothetical protein